MAHEPNEQVAGGVSDVLSRINRRFLQGLTFSQYLRLFKYYDEFEGGDGVEGS